MGPLNGIRTVGGRRAASHLLALLTSGLLILLSTSAGHAGETESFRFQPHPIEVQGHERRTFSFDLPAGTSVTDAVQLTNKTDEVRRFRIYAADATEDASGNVTVDEFGAPREGIGGWIELHSVDHSLLPRTSEVVPFTLRRPPGHAARGVGAIVAEELAEPDDGGGIQVVFRIAILVRVGGDPTGLSVGEPTLSTPVELLPSVSDASIELTNETLGPVHATVRLTVQSLTGREWPLDPVEVELAPGGSTVVEQPWSTVPRWGGAFRVRADATWEAGTVSRSGPRHLLPASWLLAFAIVAVGARGIREMRDPRRDVERRADHARAPADQPDDRRVQELVGS